MAIKRYTNGKNNIEPTDAKIISETKKEKNTPPVTEGTPPPEVPPTTTTNEFTGGEGDGSYNPLENPVITEGREYTSGPAGAAPPTPNMDQGQDIPDIPEPDITPPPAADNGFGGSTDSGTSAGGEQPYPMTDAEKQQDASETADSLLETYYTWVPIPFVHFSTVSEGKVNNLIIEDKINPYQKLTTGNSVLDFIKSRNEKALATFERTPAQRERIRKPLIAVLLKRDIIMTPEQRLLKAIGEDIGAMILATVQNNAENNKMMETFMQIHREQMEEAARQREATQTKDNTTKNNVPPADETAETMG